MSTALDSNIAALLAILKPSIADHLTAECDCCISDQRSAEQWLEKLSPSNHADNAIELYRLMPSIVKHNCDGKTKIAILDSLAPTVIKTTECLLQNRLNQAATLCEEIKKSHRQVAISNFGVAINPFKMFERIEADFVKIDRMIVEKLAHGDEGKKEFQKVMGGMTGTGIDVIVPFVEKASIMPLLWQQGVQYIQGHYISRPSFTMDYDFSAEP